MTWAQDTIQPCRTCGADLIFKGSIFVHKSNGMYWMDDPYPGHASLPVGHVNWDSPITQFTMWD